MGEMIKRICAKLTSSQSGIVTLLVLGMTIGAIGTGFAASETNVVVVLIVVAAAGIVANRFCFDTLESDIFFGLSLRGVVESERLV